MRGVVLPEFRRQNCDSLAAVAVEFQASHLLTLGPRRFGWQPEPEDFGGWPAARCSGVQSFVCDPTSAERDSNQSVACSSHVLRN